MRRRAELLTPFAALTDEIAACGRARWEIENETFNVMKNHGYELEHNFGHRERFLPMTPAALNLLAFAWHSALDLVEPKWQAARPTVIDRLAHSTKEGLPCRAISSPRIRLTTPGFDCDRSRFGADRN